MKEIARTNNVIELSWMSAVLEESGIHHVVFDMHTAFAEGSIPAIEKRLMVCADEYDEACRAIIIARQSLDDES